MIHPPTYEDGIFDLYRIKSDESADFPEEVLEDQHMRICYKEISIFDRTRYQFDQGGIELTMKIRIPLYKYVNSKCVCIIEGKQHLVYNAAHVKDKNGFPETELTLIRPERELRII